MPAIRTLTIQTDGYDDDGVQYLIEVIAAAEAHLAAVAAGAEAEDAVAGWTLGRAETLLDRLLADGSGIQANVIAEAAASGGDVGRAKVYELGGYAEGRSLKGFTRPVNRIVKEMKAAGTLPEGAPVPFAPIYDPNIRAFQQASGFRIPEDLVDLFAEATAE